MILADTCSNLHLPEKLIGKGLDTNLEGIWAVKGIQSRVSRGDKRNLTYLALQRRARVASFRNTLESVGKQKSTIKVILKIRGFLVTEAVRIAF